MIRPYYKVTAMVFALAAMAGLAGPVAAQPPGIGATNPRSGMLLGVYAFPNNRGLRIVNTIPGYSAHGRLFANDVLLRISDGVNTYRIRSIADIERAKDRIGPFTQAAIEFYRPYAGRLYAWVEFQPVGGGAAAAMMRTEEERPGAREFFDQGNEANNGGGAHFGQDPAEFFRRSRLIPR